MEFELWIPSLGRDPFSMMSHLLGALLSLTATYVLVRRARRNGMRGIGVGTYGIMMALTFSASTLFHFVDASSPRFDVYNKLDHVAIFLMIAGTGTAVYGALQSWWADHLTGALWGVAGLGILFQLQFWAMPDWLSATIYLTVGWLGSLGVFVIARITDEHSLRLFLLGAAAFTVGAIVYAAGWPAIWTGIVGPHDVFHVFVLLGAAFHFGYVYRHCTTPALVENPSPTDPSRTPGRNVLTSSDQRTRADRLSH